MLNLKYAGCYLILKALLFSLYLRSGIKIRSRIYSLLSQNLHLMKKKNIICCFIVLLLLPTISYGQWQATMTNTISGNKQHYIVYSDMNQYRYEFNQDGINGLVIVNPAENITAIILLDEKMVHYTPADGMTSVMNDPAQAYNSYKQYGVEKTEGKETISGYECTKKVIYQGETALISSWFSEELNFPVKMENHYTENTYMLLENVRPWDLDPAMFIVPPEYIEVDSKQRPVIPEPTPPEKWNIKDVGVPVDIDLNRGMAVNVTIDETVYHKLLVENTGDTPTRFSYHSFIDGKELPEDIQGPAEHRTKRLYMEENYKITNSWKAGQTILIKVYEGNLNLQIIKE